MISFCDIYDATWKVDQQKDVLGKKKRKHRRQYFVFSQILNFTSVSIILTILFDVLWDIKFISFFCK